MLENCVSKRPVYAGKTTEEARLISVTFLHVPCCVSLQPFVVDVVLPGMQWLGYET